MERRRKDAATLIELIMVVAIIGILAVSGAWLMMYFVRNSAYIPNQLHTDMVASGALRIMIEGDNRAKGLRFSRSVTSIPNSYQIAFVNQDNQSIEYRMDTSANKLYRSIDAGAETEIPYYASGLTLTGVNGSLFTYYNSADAITTAPAAVRRIAIHLIAKSGSGSYSDWQGQSQQASSIAVKAF